MSRTRGKQVVSIRGIFGRKVAQKDASVRKPAAYYNMRSRKYPPPQKSSGSKVLKGPKRFTSIQFGRRNLKGADSSMTISSDTSGSDGQRLLHDFVDSINTTHSQIEEDISKSLVEAERALEKRVAQTISEHDEKLELSRATRAAIFSPLEPESLKSAASLAKSKDKIHLADVCNILSPTEKALKRHWKAWAKTQQKIACLAVEILGPESVALPRPTREAMGSGAFKKRLASAADAFEKQESVELKMLADVQKCRDDIACLAGEMRKQVTAQEKKSRDSKRKQREEICQLARKMIANI
ncbi:hypothetical protein BDDG_08095 [Blastomyces dermatitidis ATCC 18188]|uniref:Uncharacterized protein n=1 Tax=Ajellomyces dermatitidis (strain ATCC 18188 / CBS 674.68) TaxID=653446 RepID=F2TPI7_AJEDA|nr:hypothetical protein BDDG_08095 [Blastomyces dermatitidis ATCC 18188]